MTHIVLTPEQTLLIRHAGECVTVLDCDGYLLGTLAARGSAFSSEEWREMKAAFESDMARVPSQTVLNRLRR